jgi:replicative DNA helicase
MESLEDDQIKKYVDSLFKYTISSSNTVNVAKTLKKCSLIRNLSESLQDAQEAVQKFDGTQSVSDILACAERPILDFSTGITEENKLISIDNYIDDYIQHVIDNPNQSAGLSSGYPIWDKAIGGGLRRGNISIIGARLKQGKSQLALNVAIHNIKCGVPVLYLDTEMLREEQMARFIANVLHIPIDNIENGQFTEDQLKSATKINQSPALKYFTHENVSGYSFDKIYSLIKRWLFKCVGKTNGVTNTCLVVYDYLKVMDSSDISKSMQEHQTLGFATSKLKDFAVEYDVPILTFVQLNRDGIDKETTAAAAGSDRILWFGTNFSIFKRKTAEEIAEDGIKNGNRKLIPIVSRHGREWDFERDYINMQLDGEFAMVTEISKKSDIHKLTSTEISTFENASETITSLEF